MVPESLHAEIMVVAEQQADRPDDELMDLLQYEWDRAGISLADRGPREYLQGVWSDLLAQAVSQQDTVGVMTAMVANDALNWAAAHGYASNEYAFVIGVLVAWVTRAALRQQADSDDAADLDKKQ